MKEIEVEAVRTILPDVLELVDESLEEVLCPALTQTAIEIAVEEIFVNISNYAYDAETGTVVVQVAIHDDPLAIEISFTDSGVPYDPLAKPDPDTTLSVKQRKIGGLGIYMVKKSMDDVRYEYKDGKNILTIRKILD